MKNFHENHRTYKILKERKRHKKIDNWRARRAFRSSQRRNGLVGPDFRAGRRRARARTHTRAHLLQMSIKYTS